MIQVMVTSIINSVKSKSGLEFSAQASLKAVADYII